MRKAQNAVVLDNTADKFTANVNAPASESVPFYYTEEEVKNIDKHAKKVTQELNKAEKAFTSVACEVRWLFKDDRYKALATASTFEQFLSDRYGFKKSQGYALCKLVDRFGEQDSDGNYSIKKEFVSFGQSKLMLMCPLTDEQIKDNIDPAMTVAELRKAVKKLTKSDSLGISDVSERSENSEQEEQENDNDNVIDSNVVSEKVVNEIASYSDFKTFEDDSITFFNLVNDAFKNANGRKMRVVISYEYD
mgnify:CR=1 FL=1